jgi:hypothetical protein
MATENELEVQPLLVPFDISLPAPTLRADDAPSQEVAHTAALCAATGGIDHGDKFNEAGVIRKPLGYFKCVYKTKNTGVALELIHKQTQGDLGSSDMVTGSDSSELSWNTDRHYIDLMICVPVGLGLAALLPNQARLHNTLDLKQPYRTFSAKFSKLGFDPTGTMLWIGRSHSSEDVWADRVVANGMRRCYAWDMPWVDAAKDSTLPYDDDVFRVNVEGYRIWGRDCE